MMCRAGGYSTQEMADLCAHAAHFEAISERRRERNRETRKAEKVL